MNEAARWNKIINRLASQLTGIQVQLASVSVALEEALLENEQLKAKLEIAEQKKEKGNGKLASSERLGEASGADQPEVPTAQ